MFVVSMCKFFFFVYFSSVPKFGTLKKSMFVQAKLLKCVIAFYVMFFFSFVYFSSVPKFGTLRKPMFLLSKLFKFILLGCFYLLSIVLSRVLYIASPGGPFLS